MQSTNAGRDFQIYNQTLSTNDVAFRVTTGYTPSNPPSGYVMGQIMNACSILIRCRTAADIYLRRTQNDSNYLTIPSGTTFSFDISPSNSQNCFFLRAAAGTPVAEILVTIE